ncbi:SAM-dependent methyltransferase [Spirillospora sp. CA-128828]|uniref:SAM-dependent methyltransferase n=1 Tax=Spirillospora sp. CA-128828 TaxID=3240033 RepID=UPI003D90E803
MQHRIDVSRPSPARIYDYLLGGKDNFAVDRELAEKFLARWPALATTARVNRAWAVRVVRHLAGERGIDQFVDVGSGLPTADNVHQVAQRITPGARVMYVDNDPIVLAHSRALLAENQGADYVAADAQDADTVLARADRFLDPSRPVAILMASLLHYLPEPPEEVVAPTKNGRLRTVISPSRM